jgi:hypothetical protein
MAAPSAGSAGETVRVISHRHSFLGFQGVSNMQSAMINRSDKGQTICERLQKLGYAKEKHIKLYGEEFHLVSNPVPDGDGFAVEGIARTSGNLKRMRIPLSLVCTVRKELALNH